MIAVAIVALFLWLNRAGTAVVPAVVGRPSFSSRLARRMRQRELARSEQERDTATRRDAIEANLMASPEFAAKSPDEQRRIVKVTVEFHELQSKEARLAAEGWREKRLLEETAAWWCWDPDADAVGRTIARFIPSLMWRHAL